MGEMTIVTVDFDGTLYQGNSFNVMFSMAKREFTMTEWLVVGTGLVKAVTAGVSKGKNAFRLQFFQAFAKAFKGKTKAELDLFFQKLVETGKKDVHHQLITKIKEHQQLGHTVILLSGALEPFLTAFSREMDLDVHIISTKLKYDQNGICTGEISKIVNGEEKVKEVRKWISKNTANDPQEIWAYADSESDIPLFEIANYPFVVNPDNTMKKIAKRNDWPVFG